MRLAPSKQLLIQAIPELPSWLLNRPKRGFFFPFQQWIEKEWSDYFPAHELGKDINLKLWYRRWSLAILQYWWQQVNSMINLITFKKIHHKLTQTLKLSQQFI